MDFRVLGTTIVTGAGGIISVTALQLRTVLALLIASPGEVVSTAKIIEALWPETGPRQPSNGKNRVHQLIRDLRELLGVDNLIVTRDPGYLLNIERSATDHGRLHAAVTRARGEDDLHRRVEILRDALAEWRGDPFADITSAELDVDRQRFTDLRIAAFDLCIEAELELGRHRETIGEIREWVTRHPLLERLHYHLILAIYRCDGAVEAQKAFWRCRDLLIE